MAPPPPPVPPPPMAQRGGGKQKRVACCRGIVLKQCHSKEHIDSKEFQSEDEWLPHFFDWRGRLLYVLICLYLFSWASFKCLGHLQVSSHIGRPWLRLPHRRQHLHQFLRQASKNPPHQALHLRSQRCFAVPFPSSQARRPGQWRTRWMQSSCSTWMT